MPIFLSILLIFLGAGFLYGAFKRHIFVRRLMEEGMKTAATIVDILKVEENDPEDGKSILYYHTYKYIDLDNIVCQYTPNETTSLEKYRIGDKVPIIYMPGEDDSVVILTRFGTYGNVFWMSVLGLVWLVFGIAQLLSSGIIDRWIE